MKRPILVGDVSASSASRRVADDADVSPTRLTFPSEVERLTPCFLHSCSDSSRIQSLPRLVFGHGVRGLPPHLEGMAFTCEAVIRHPGRNWFGRFQPIDRHFEIFGGSFNFGHPFALRDVVLQLFRGRAGATFRSGRGGLAKQALPGGVGSSTEFACGALGFCIFATRGDVGFLDALVAQVWVILHALV